MVPVIHDIRAMCNPVEDINLMKRVAVLMEGSVRQRQEEVEQMRSELKPLTSKLVSARQSCQRPTSVPTPAAHAQTISKLDAKRFKLVKSIEEGEGALNEKEAEYRRLKAELKELEEKDVTNDVELDGTAVRLNLYRELGFQWVEDKASDEASKIIIRSESDDVHLVRLDDSLRDFELKNRLWELNSK
ncbi:hypothetical protein FRC01_003945 [Tulasnella sp. 417]|nr:hypothetical protein FRC01_003945 [Tulasnella sp. 417]